MMKMAIAALCALACVGCLHSVTPEPVDTSVRIGKVENRPPATEGAIGTMGTPAYWSDDKNDPNYVPPCCRPNRP